MRWGPQWWRYVDMYFDDLTYWIYLGFREDEKKDTHSPARCLLGSNLWNKRDQISGKREQKEIKWWLGGCWGGDRYPASQLSVQDLTIALLRKPAFENHPEDKKVAAEQKPTFICGIFQENAFRSQKKVLSQSHVYTGGRYISIYMYLYNLHLYLCTFCIWICVNLYLYLCTFSGNVFPSQKRSSTSHM